MKNESCGTCALCCKLPKVDEIGKPMGEWCAHCRPGLDGACSIFGAPERPKICGEYLCVWRLSEMLPELRPDRCGFILDTTEGDPNTIRVLVRPDRPDAYRTGIGGRYLRKLQASGVRIVVVFSPTKRRILTTLADREAVSIIRRRA